MVVWQRIEAASSMCGGVAIRRRRSLCRAYLDMQEKREKEYARPSYLATPERGKMSTVCEENNAKLFLELPIDLTNLESK